MAEPVSAIVALAIVGLDIIKKTAQFIDEVHTIDAALARLKSTLANFESRIKLVKSTCARVPRDDEASGYVKKTLKRCNRHLEKIQDVVQGLVERESQSLFQQVALTIITKRSKKDIELAITDIKDLMDQVNLGLNCWNIHLSHDIERRVSEAPPAVSTANVRHELRSYESQQQPLFTNTLEDAVIDEPTSPLSRATTAYNFDSESPRQSISSATPGSRSSISSASTRYSRHPERTGSIVSGVGSIMKDSKADFHVKVSQCGGAEAEVFSIKADLEQGEDLANSMNKYERTPLHHAAHRGEINVGRVLLQAKSDPNAKDIQKVSVLDLAVEGNHTDFVSLLHEYNVQESTLSPKNCTRYNEILGEIELRKEIQKSTRKEKSKKLPKPSKSSKVGGIWGRKAMVA